MSCVLQGWGLVPAAVPRDPRCGVAVVFVLEQPFCGESNPGWALRGAACPDAVLLLQSLPAGALLSRSVTSPETGGQEGRHCSIAEMRKLEDREQTHIHMS